MSHSHLHVHDAIRIDISCGKYEIRLPKYFILILIGHHFHTYLYHVLLRQWGMGMGLMESGHGPRNKGGENRNIRGLGIYKQISYCPCVARIFLIYKFINTSH